MHRFRELHRVKNPHLSYHARRRVSCVSWKDRFLSDRCMLYRTNVALLCRHNLTVFCPPKYIEEYAVGPIEVGMQQIRLLINPSP